MNPVVETVISGPCALEFMNKAKDIAEGLQGEKTLYLVEFIPSTNLDHYDKYLFVKKLLLCISDLDENMEEQLSQMKEGFKNLWNEFKVLIYK